MKRIVLFYSIVFGFAFSVSLALSEHIKGFSEYTIASKPNTSVLLSCDTSRGWHFLKGVDYDVSLNCTQEGLQGIDIGFNKRIGESVKIQISNMTQIEERKKVIVVDSSGINGNQKTNIVNYFPAKSDLVVGIIQ